MICNALGPSPDDGLLECRCRRHQALGYLPLENQAVGDIIPEPAAESCEDCVECSGLDAAQMCCWLSRLWPRHWHGAYACFSTMAGTRVAHLFFHSNALMPSRHGDVSNARSFLSPFAKPRVPPTPRSRRSPALACRWPRRATGHHPTGPARSRIRRARQAPQRLDHSARS